MTENPASVSPCPGPDADLRGAAGRAYQGGALVPLAVPHQHGAANLLKQTHTGEPYKMNTSRPYSRLSRSLLLLAFLVFASSIAGGCASATKPTASPSVTPPAVVQPCSASVRKFPLPASTLIPTQITTGPDSKLWIIETPTTATQATPQDSFLGRLTPPSFQQFVVPFSLANLNALTDGPDGNLWYVRYGRVGRLTPAGQVHEFPLPERESNVGGIIAGPDGNLWFTESRADVEHPVAKIGRITPGGHVQEFTLPTPNSEPGGITVGPDGNLWFTESAELSNEVALIGRITPTGVASEFALPRPLSHLNKIIAGPDGNLWFTEAVASPDGQHAIGTIGRITPGGSLREFAFPSSGDHVPQGLAVGPDRTLWFTDFHTLGRITLSGTISECASFPTQGAFLTDIAEGRDGHLWFTASGQSGGYVGQVG